MNMPEDSIDALLREQNAYIDDAGFTARVIKKLPRRRSVRLRPMIMLGAVGIGLVLALRWLPLNHLPPLDPSTLLSSDASILLPWATVLIVAASLVLGAISAFEWED
jgi:hypothetical protein